MVDLDHFILHENPQIDDYLVGTYLYRKPLRDSAEILNTAVMMATEQTTGTWIRVPGETQDMIKKFRGKVLNIWEIPDTEQFNGITDVARSFILQLGFPWENFGPQIPMMLTTVFGNISMIGDIKLLDIQFPKRFVEGFPGPRFGIKGIRKMLGVPERPLLNNMVKPSTGITPDQGARFALPGRLRRNRYYQRRRGDGKYGVIAGFKTCGGIYETPTASRERNRRKKALRGKYY